MSVARFLRLDGDATTLLIAVEEGVPAILHWGARLPADEDPASLLAAGLRPPMRTWLEHDPGVPLLPDGGRGYAGACAVSMHRDGADWVTSLRLVSGHLSDGVLELALADPQRGVSIGLRLGLAMDVLTASLTLRNTGATALDLMWCASLVLPVPAGLTDLVASGGRWCRETILERAALPPQAYLAEQRTGRTSHAITPALTLCDATCDDDRGAALSVCLAWSGNHRMLVDRLPDGRRVLQGGALLLPGEIRLRPGEAWQAPDAHATWTGQGLNGVRRLWHEFVRRSVLRPLDGPRKVHLNTWEALYFDHDPARLRALAEAAAGLGVERFVLDDGWFLGRGDDRRALGDWTPDPVKYPDGLGPLIAHVRGLGMEFGLWVEPEMVNPDSELFRRHPDWILSVPGIAPVSQRGQYVLDLGRDEVFAHLLDALDRLLAGNAIGYLKWDMNRDLTTAGHEGRASVDRQTRAVYRLLDTLRARHPGVEIESCASGGGRADLGILRRTDRVWASDCNDAIERISIHRGFGLYLPPEIMGAHVGPVRSHTTGRHLGIAFQASVALFGHFGLELDATAIDDEERETLRRWIWRYKQFRPLLHDGFTRMLAVDDPGLDARAVVSRDGGEALVLCARLRTSEHQLPPPQRIPGLDANDRFSVSVLELAGEANGAAGTTPFLSGTPAILSGTALACVGVRLPALSPASSVLIHLRRIGPVG